MDQNAAALSHYYHLRSQEVSPASARQHVAQRFGVFITAEMPAPNEAVRAIPASDDIGSEFTANVPITGTSTGPQYGVPPRIRNWCEHCKDDPAGQRWLCPFATEHEPL